jgi:hypothetical protein
MEATSAPAPDLPPVIAAGHRAPGSPDFVFTNLRRF